MRRPFDCATARWLKSRAGHPSATASLLAEGGTPAVGRCEVRWDQKVSAESLPMASNLTEDRYGALAFPATERS
jgi:hypothetical protein